MNTDADLERMARKAGIYPSAELRIFADLIRADERERCAKVCEGLREAAEHSSDGLKRAGALSMATSCAKLIRA
jgi:hypothetical protein